MVAPQKVALSMYPMGPTLKEEFPEVIDFVRIRQDPNMPISYGEKRVELEKMLWADENFFDMFGFQLIEGEPSQVLKAAVLDPVKSLRSD